MNENVRRLENRTYKEIERHHSEIMLNEWFAKRAESEIVLNKLTDKRIKNEISLQEINLKLRLIESGFTDRLNEEIKKNDKKEYNKHIVSYHG